MSQHATHSPSSMYRWKIDRCPGSIALSKGKPDISGPAAREGTRAHTALEVNLFAIHEHLRSSDKPIPPLRKESAAGVDYALRIIDEMVEKERMRVIGLEEKVVISDDVWGTLDIIGHCQETESLFIIDYKNGIQPVSIYKNTQLWIYAWGAFLKLHGNRRLISKIVTTIIQPNSKDGTTIAHEYITLPKLYDFSVYVEESVKATKDPNAPRRTGYWCQWCLGQPDCPEYKELQKQEVRPTEKDDITIAAINQYRKLIKEKP